MSTTDIVPRSAAIQHWDAGFQKLVTSTVLKPSKRDATAAELALLAEQAIRTGLDPMARQIYGIYRYDSRAGGEVMTLQVGIDGLRAIAERTGSYLGQSGPFWCGPDGVWTDVWLHKDPPSAARVVVRKAIGSHIAETSAVAHYEEYVSRKRDGSVTQMWNEKPALMLSKCSEALALRKAFPQDMSGLYTDDEMSSAAVEGEAIEVTSSTNGSSVTEPAGDRYEIAIAAFLASGDKVLDPLREVADSGMRTLDCPPSQRLAELRKATTKEALEVLITRLETAIAGPATNGADPA